MSIAHAAGRRLTPAAEWLLDNHYLIEEQVFLAQKHLPRGYSRKLPRLSAGELTGLPRIYDIVLEFIAHVDGRVDDEALSRYIDAYQSVTRLTLGELWSVAIMLRLALIENLRRVAVTMSWKRQHRDCAIAWAQRLESPSDAQDGALLVLADLVRENPPLSTAFVAQFTQTLQGRGATTTFVLSWLEQRLGERGQTIEEVLRAENQSQAADQASMANSIASLRLVNATEWPKFVETHSSTEAILRGDPSGVYSQMDFVTRDEYRHVVENTARRLRLDEESVAQTAIALAAAHHSEHCSDAKAHVGYLLVDEGKGSLERALRGRAAARQPPGSLHRWLKLFAYFVPVTALTAVGALCLTWLARQAPGHAVPLVALCSALAASAVAIAVTNWFASIARRPRALPRMDFEHGIPDACRTMVVVPTLLSCQERIAETLEGLEIRYLANRDPNLWFGLLTDYSDAAEEHMEGDEALLGQAAAGIEALNGSYCNGEPSRFYLLHRPRLFNAHEGCWMGRERKRGKLEDFNAILCGDDQARFERIVGDLSQLTTIKYVITLDTDTKLPWGAGWRMVGAAAHPLNRPMMRADGRRLARGYAVLQPRVGISLPSAAQSHYSRLHAGDVGIDPYTRVVSDLYQDLFEEASYIGKGLYDVGTFRQLLDERFPNNAVLSHDLLESCFARAGMCSDVELLEDAPSAYLTDVSRRHRWMRGDWQLLPWLGLLVRDASGKLRYPSLTGLGWWKIFDNLRRTLVAPATAALLTLGFILLPSPLFFTLALLLVIFLPELLPGFAELWNRPSRLPLRLHVAMVGRSSGRRLSRAALSLAFLPYEALSALDAAARTLWRMFFSRRHLLEWQTAASCERAEPSSFVRLLGQMWVSPLLASALAAALITRGSLMPLVSAGPILLAWFLSPLLAWWISRPLSSNAKDLDKEDVDGLRRLARLTWRYFEVFVGPHESWLPP
ncbi:MAG: cyclic beta 1-2 glucan synthetase, partial [Polyangia bacterium]|nr:cyclic beta 1-2 glucan synthetase [Polyangia bacterium]